MIKKILVESSSMTPSEKMDAWHNGHRRENISACSDEKLALYHNICARKGYSEVYNIRDEAAKRGLPWGSIQADVHATIADMLAARRTGMPFLDEIDFHLADAQFVKDAKSVQQIIVNCMTSNDILKYTIISLIFLMLIKNENYTNQLKDYMINNMHIDKEDLKKTILRAINDEDIKQRLIGIKDSLKY